MEVTGRYYNTKTQISELESLYTTLSNLRAPQNTPPAHNGARKEAASYLPESEDAARQVQRQRRLTREQAIELIERYQGGATMRDLAALYAINRNTVSAILRRHGVLTRPRGLSPEEVGNAAQLYADGKSLASIGRGFGVDAETVRTRLRQHGIRMRDPHGRARQSPTSALLGS